MMMGKHDDTVENMAILEIHKSRLQGFLQSNSAMIDYSKMSLRGAMLLNGAGIIPIVYSKVDYLYETALVFGWGAFLAVCATGVAYLIQWRLTAYWNLAYIHYPFRTASLGPEEEKEERAARRFPLLVPFLRLAAISLVVLSLGCFGYGLYHAGKTISSTQGIRPAADAGIKRPV